MGAVGASDPQCHQLPQRLCFELSILASPLVVLSSHTRQEPGCSRGLEAGLGGCGWLPSQRSAPTLPAPQRPPGAYLIGSRPDPARGPGPGGKPPPLPEPLEIWLSGEPASPWVIYRGVQEPYPACFCSLPGCWVARLSL